MRQGKTQKFNLTIAELQETAAVATPDLAAQLGMEVQDLTPDLAQRLGLAHTQGVLVAEVDDEGPAAEAGIRRGDVILEVNRQRVHTSEEYAEALHNTSDDTALLLVARGDTTLYVALKQIPQ